MELRKLIRKRELLEYADWLLTFEDDSPLWESTLAKFFDGQLAGVVGIDDTGKTVGICLYHMISPNYMWVDLVYAPTQLMRFWSMFIEDCKSVGINRLRFQSKLSPRLWKKIDAEQLWTTYEVKLD